MKGFKNKLPFLKFRQAKTKTIILNKSAITVKKH